MRCPTREVPHRIAGHAIPIWDDQSGQKRLPTCWMLDLHPTPPQLKTSAKQMSSIDLVGPRVVGLMGQHLFWSSCGTKADTDVKFNLHQAAQCWFASHLPCNPTWVAHVAKLYCKSWGQRMVHQGYSPTYIFNGHGSTKYRDRLAICFLPSCP